MNYRISIPALVSTALAVDMYGEGKTADHPADVDLTLHVYPGAKHAFTNPMATLLGKKLDIPIEHDGKEDEDSWSALTRFLKAIYPN